MDQSPLSQVILENDSVRLTFGRDILGENNVIQTVSKYAFISFYSFRRVSKQEYVGTVLCGYNEINALQYSVDELNSRMKNVYFLHNLFTE